MSDNIEIKDIHDRLSTIDISLAKLEVHMGEHMKRSNLNEEAVTTIRKEQFRLALALIGAMAAALLEMWLRK